ncbi:MAG: hypothetical protein AB1427_21850 [Thermodesulfobacteriota bacterium]
MRILFALLPALLLSIQTDAAAAGKVWCNDRYLTSCRQPFDQKHLEVARRGYLYALAGALVLQTGDKEGREHFFALPGRMLEIERPARDKSGFEVAAYELYRDAARTELLEVIIAFAGANDYTDWKETNFGFSLEQYEQARRYISRIARVEKYAGVRMVAVGYSLGGALAVHVTKHPETSNFIAEAWALNPSPKVYAKGNIDRRIWVAAVEHDALKVIRKHPFTSLPGVARIGAPESQTAEGYYLISSSPIYAHFRWVLARNLLHAADLALSQADPAVEGTEPLEILKLSNFVECKN